MSSKISQELQRVKLTLTASAKTPMSYRKIDFFKADRFADIALRWSAREASYPFL